ncbi:IS66 family insertion sequence element accessory protein TnpB [Oxalobacteraceae sp. CFBP 8753]|nr:IS66 family insertion sequence element accessory protein TnpB [Oxalobacteraceae sp. CFBP 8753]
MFFPEGQVRVFPYGQPVNMRLSFNGLYALAKHVMHQDPLSGNRFAFINREPPRSASCRRSSSFALV